MIQLIRGFKDILPGEVGIWQHIEKTARALFEDFGYREIRIPILADIPIIGPPPRHSSA